MLKAKAIREGKDALSEVHPQKGSEKDLTKEICHIIFLEALIVFCN